MLRPASQMLGTTAAAVCLALLAGCTNSPEGASGTADSPIRSASPTQTPEAAVTPTGDPSLSVSAPPAFDMRPLLDHRPGQPMGGGEQAPPADAR